MPVNCTDRLQPPDLSVNKPAKKFLRVDSRNGIPVRLLISWKKTQVDMRFNIKKPFDAYWLAALYDHICANPIFIVNWHHLGHS